MAKLSFAQKIKSLFSKYNTTDSDFFEDLTDALIEGDVGAKTAFEIVERLEKFCKEERLSSKDEIVKKLTELLSSFVKSFDLQPIENKTNIWMVLGVNGVGKTTSVAKMASYYKNKGFPVVLAASDTFRAAAIEQLQMHGQRLGIRVIHHQDGSDPSSVVFDAAESVTAFGGGLVIADTAGRLHNKDNLVRELQKIDRICEKKASEGCYKKILVVDATTGQNALRQAEVFNEAVKIDALVLTKYDSTAKGGVAVSIGKELGIPIVFICNGEKYEDIDVFNVQNYVEGFIGE